MSRPQRSPEDFPHAFEAAFARLQVVLVEAVDGEPGWPAKIAAAIVAGLGFAAANPEAAQTLTNEALAHGIDGIARYERLIAYLSEGLAAGRAQRPEGERLPDITEHAMASGTVMLVAQRIDRGRAGELPLLVPEAIQFVLTPYLGTDEARRIAARFLPGDSKEV